MKAKILLSDKQMYHLSVQNLKVNVRVKLPKHISTKREAGSMDIHSEVDLKFRAVSSGGFLASVVFGRGWSGEGAKVPAIAEIGAVSVLLCGFLHSLAHGSGRSAVV